MISRLIYDIPIDGGDSGSGSSSSGSSSGSSTSPHEEFMAGMGYAPVTSYTLRGQRFTYGDWVNVRIYRISLPNGSSSSLQADAGDSNSAGVPSSNKEDGMTEVKGKTAAATAGAEGGGGEEKERLLDESGAYVMEASVKVRDGQDLKTMSKGVEALVGFRDVLWGCVDLEIGERLSLDTRVR